MSTPLRLGVNIDHVATIRNARGGDHPDPVRAAEIVAAVGGDGYARVVLDDIDALDTDGLQRDVVGRIRAGRCRRRVRLACCRSPLSTDRASVGWEKPRRARRERAADCYGPQFE